MRASTRPLLLLGLALGLSAGSLAAQSVLRGTILDTAGTAIGGVDITLVGGATVTSGADGAFRLGGIPEGRQQLIFRRIGFSAQQLVRDFGAADTLTVRVVLGETAVILPEVTVEERAPIRSPKLAIFESRRAAHGGGTFLTDSILRDREHSQLSDVLRRVGGLRFVLLPNGGGRAVVTSRGANFSLSLARRDGCYSQVYVDGLRVWSLKDLPAAGPYNIDQHNVSDLGAIEVYRGEAQTPSEMSIPGSECGTVVLWTRDR